MHGKRYMAKYSILAILEIIMKELGFVDFEHYKAIHLLASFRDSLLGWRELTLAPSVRTQNAISLDIYTAE